MNKKTKEIYTVATAHLDTSWLWTFEKTVDEYIPKTLRNNFEFFEKYPEYTFNFEGSYRYELMEEYYPDEFEKLKKYIEQGRWQPCGSCYENGDVNTPSPEALIRNIVYGNGYFEEKFGKPTNDIFLPDCFGFGKALPSVAAHCGLKGFSTQKLSWGVCVDVPFDTGRWVGNDGNGLWCSLKPGAYITTLGKIRKNPAFIKKLRDSGKYGLDKTLCYHGVGDRGGAPAPKSVRNVIKELRKNADKSTKVYSTSTNKFFDDIEALTDEQKMKLPVYDGELLLSEHGAGSYTSRAVSKRWNRRSEMLADAAEKFSSASYALSLSDYPENVLDTAWKKVIAHQFHDDITGTSFQQCYRRNWNDYVLAMNLFSAEYTAAIKNIASKLDTSFVEGIPVIVSNPVQASVMRQGAVSVILPNDMECEHIRVFDGDGNEVLSQLVKENGKNIAVFMAKLPSVGAKVYDVRVSDKPCSLESELFVSAHTIENKYIKVTINESGDIASIYDKTLCRELLGAPIKTALLNDVCSIDWPAWEVKYKDISAPAYAYADMPVIEIKENGKARAAIEIMRAAGKSTFKQIISLDAENRYINVYNETDWREEAAMLKTEFTLAASNESASYDIGIGSTQRRTNTKRLFEVPAQKWADITDRDDSFGVSVFSDSRSGWDKPTDSTLRLTCVHTPMSNYRWECSQHLLDLGLNRYSYAVCGHNGRPDEIPSLAEEFCQPMHTFVTEKHSGSLGREFSFFTLSSDRVRVMAIKKKQRSNEIILRVVETTGSEQKNITAEFALAIKRAYAVGGDEKIIEEIPLKDGRLVFDMKKNEIKSFALQLEKGRLRKAETGKRVELPYNAVAVTRNCEREKSTLPGKISVPYELMPDKYLYSGIEYYFEREYNSAVICRGQTVQVDGKKLHMLVTSLNGDKNVLFKTETGNISVLVQDYKENVGAWDIISLGETGYIKEAPQALTFTHTHKANGDETAKLFHLFHVEIEMNDSNTLTLPDDEDILIFAATSESESVEFYAADEHFDKLDKREFDYKVSKYAKNKSQPTKWEKILDKRFDRTKVAEFNIGPLRLVQSPSEFYYAARFIPTIATYDLRRSVIKMIRKKGK